MKFHNAVSSVPLALILATGAAFTSARQTAADKNPQATPSNYKAGRISKQSSAFTQIDHNSGAGVRLTRDPEVSQSLADSYRKAREGDAAASEGAWQAAKISYQQALALVPGNRQAIYGMARCAGAAGDTATEIKFYRAAIYTDDLSRYGTVPGDGYQENDISRLMEYALLLNKTSQDGEAVSVYNRAAGLLDFDPTDGHQREKALLPQFGDEPGQEAYTPRKLEAAAHLAIGIEADGHDGYGTLNAIHEFQQAVAIAPDLAEAHFYLGRYLYGKGDPAAKVELQRAAKLGSTQTAVAAKEFLKLIH